MTRSIVLLLCLGCGSTQVKQEAQQRSSEAPPEVDGQSLFRDDGTLRGHLTQGDYVLPGDQDSMRVSVWHFGQPFLMLHYRFPVTRDIPGALPAKNQQQPSRPPPPRQPPAGGNDTFVPPQPTGPVQPTRPPAQPAGPL